jgi:hypothetical protein
VQHPTSNTRTHTHAHTQCHTPNTQNTLEVLRLLSGSIPWPYFFSHYLGHCKKGISYFKLLNCSGLREDNVYVILFVKTIEIIKMDSDGSCTAPARLQQQLRLWGMVTIPFSIISVSVFQYVCAPQEYDFLLFLTVLDRCCVERVHHTRGRCLVCTANFCCRGNLRYLQSYSVWSLIIFILLPCC